MFARSAAQRHLSGLVQPPPPGLWKILHGCMPVTIPTTQSFFPNIPSSSEGVAVKEKPTTQYTRLANQVIVATQEHHAHACSGGIFLCAGNRHASRQTPADAVFLAKTVLTGTDSRSEFATTRAIEAFGASVQCNTERDTTTLAFECLRANSAEVFEIVAESLSPRVDEDTLHHFMEEVNYSVADVIKTNKRMVAIDGLYSVAFGAGGLGITSLFPPKIVDASSIQSVSKFLSQRIVGANIVVAAHGVNHNQFVQAAERALGHLPAGTRKVPTSQFFGGYQNTADQTTDLAHVSIGFQGCSWHDPDLIAANALQVLLGGGDSFSAGGPGKGMLSRLYRNVLASHDWVESATSFCASHEDTGLFGFNLASDPDSASRLVSLVIGELRAVAKGEGVTGEEVQRTKNQMAMAFLSNLERRANVADDIGRQTLEYGRRQEEGELLAKIFAVSEKDIIRVASRFAKADFAVASVAPAPVLRYEEIKALLR